MRLIPLLAGALVCALGLSTAAAAATFTVAGGMPFTLKSSYDPAPGTADLAPGTVVARNAGLLLNTPGFVTFSYVGSEAGYRNQFWVGGTKLFDNKAASNTPVTLRFDTTGLLPFAFRTVSPAGTTPNGATASFAPSAYALFNDSYTGDKDYDDIVVRMDGAPIPLPAAAWLMLAGLAALGAAGRRRAAPA